ncbi:hypothetical protein EJ05DRAFT_295678, partial [Pseudovirgaria hyperparasitica]
ISRRSVIAPQPQSLHSAGTWNLDVCRSQDNIKLLSQRARHNTQQPARVERIIFGPSLQRLVSDNQQLQD